MLAFMLHDKQAPGNGEKPDAVYVAINMHWEGTSFGLPQAPFGLKWHVSVNTGVAAPGDKWPIGEEPAIADQGHIIVGGRSVVVLVGR